jgi:hypothetical protein
VIGRIAITPGAAERLAAFREQDAKRDGSNVQVTWHIPVSGVGAQLDLEGELTTDIKVDTNLIPESVRDDLAATTLDAVREYFQQPGVQEKFEKWQASRKPNNRLNDHPENS